MLEFGLIAFATFFATISPAGIAVIFAGLTPKDSIAERRRIALKGSLIALAIALFFAFFGKFALTQLGISLAAMRTAGGILLLLIAVEMVFARSSGGSGTTAEEDEESLNRDDVSVFPLATPLIAGPGTIGAAILLVAEAQNDVAKVFGISLALTLVVALTYVLMLAAAKVQSLLGVTGVHVVSRVLGILLSALAVQFLFDGIKESGLIG